LQKIKTLPDKQSQERGNRIMRDRLWKEFDKIWVRYNNSKASFQEWEKALNNWVNMETL
tara:strand:+ start:2158 stop:2334 length:177 start_codon:yes stop_codon:yes gene_type:complete